MKQSLTGALTKNSNPEPPFGGHLLRHLGISLGLSLLLTSPAGAVGTRHFVLETAKDFEAGKAEGVFIDSLGGLRPGLELSPFPVAEAPVVWAAWPTPKGVLLATGNEGKLLSFEGGKLSVVADTPSLALTTLTEGWGRIFAGALGSGEILELKGGRLVPFAKLSNKQIWALSFEPQSKALYAATGPKGEVMRIAADGSSTVHFTAEEKHLVSLATAGNTVFAGSSSKARLYRIVGPGRGEVLYDFGKTEVRAIQVGRDGAVYCLVNELKGGPKSDSWKPDRPQPAAPKEPTKGSGELYRFTTEGKAEKLFESKDDFFTALSLVSDEEALVGTGVEGRVFAVTPRLESRQIADLEERQVSALRLDGGSRGFVVSSDPVVFYEVHGLGSRAGTYTSPALDAGLRARFGRVRYEASPDVEVRFRSGNTEEASKYWSDWSKPIANGEEPSVPAARFLQFQVTMPKGPDRGLRRIEVPFLTDNLRATVQKITVESRSLAKGSRGLKSSGGPIDESPSSKLRVSFEVDNPDEDELRFRVEYAARGSQRWFDALEPGEVLTKNNFLWDTSNLAEGEYRLRVTASDELSNSPSEVGRHSLESQLVLVDNTPPQLSGWKWTGKTLVGRATDGVGPIRRVEVKLGNNKEWFPLLPVDGIFDQPSESFQVALGPEYPIVGDTLTVRAFDAALNSTVDLVRLTR